MFPGSFLLAMPVNAVTQVVPGRTRLHGSSPAQPGGDKCPKAPTPWGPGPHGSLGYPSPCGRTLGWWAVDEPLNAVFSLVVARRA